MSLTLSIGQNYSLDLADYARTGLRVGIWASSGRGKSFGVGVLCEELLAAGIPVVAIDPEGELYTLREHYRLLVLGGERGDLPLPTSERAVELALTRALDEGLALIVDLSDRPTNRSQQEAALPWLERLWVLMSERRTPAALVVEEVHVFAPQSGSSITSDILHRFAKQGRKRGVILVVASQRTQAVSKELMSQLNFPAIGGFEIERDYDAVKAVLDGHSFEEMRALPAGEFYLPAAGKFERWRPRRTSHGGDSPSWTGGGGEVPRMADTALGTLVDELRAAFAQESSSAAPPDPSDGLRREIRRLEHQLELSDEARRAAEAETERLRVALQVASVIKVVISNEVVLQVEKAAPTAVVPAPAPASLPAVTVVQTQARPATPSFRDLAIPPDQLLELPGVRLLVTNAKARARRRSPRSITYVVQGARLLARGFALTPGELAERCGSRSQVAIRRAAQALEGLAQAGFAVLRDGRHALSEAAMLRAVQAG